MTDRVEVDPVCGMEVDPESAAGYSEYEDKVYYFCTNECKQRFDLNPAEYADVS
jgi:P-type Cu+ transporter